jgi:putative Holliday junction resolvase
VGQARIGVALASRSAGIASPLTTLANDDNFAGKLQELLGSHTVDTVVVGLPRGLDGQNTPQTDYVLTFAKNLQNTTSISVVLQDEALTSVKAEEELEARGKAYTKEDVDALSATYILEDYLQGGSA